jgi:hypothetical protein
VAEVITESERKKIGIYVPLSDSEFIPYRAGAEKLLLLDAMLNETHSRSSEVTENPVESGAPVSDNIQPHANRLTLTCLVSNSPLNVDDVRETRAAEIWADLEQVRVNKQVVSVVTTLDVYENMAIESLEVPRDSSKGDCLYFTIGLKQIRTAQLVTVPAPVKPNRKPVKKKGRASLKSAAPEEINAGMSLEAGFSSAEGITPV